MQDIDFEAEVSAYLTATQSLRLSEDRAFESFNATASDLLLLIRDRWPEPAAKWFDLVQLAGNGTLSSEGFAAAQRELTLYRTVTLGEPHGNVDAHSGQAAITFMFQMAIDVRPEKGSVEYTGTSLVRLVDEFAHEFIEHFGMADAVLSALSRHF